MAPEETFDLVVIGAGPGGYVAAARAARLGLKTACVDKEPRPGGVCLNTGCIPSKALLDSTELLRQAGERFEEHGIRTGKVKADLSVMMARKEKVVEALTGNVARLLEGNRVSLIRGKARVAGPDRVEVETSSDGEKPKSLKTRAILLATGSIPASVPGLEFDGERIVDSTAALSFSEVPGHLGIIGGGYIGLELGSVWLRLGARVTVMEMLPRIASSLDGQAARALERILAGQGFSFRLRTRVVRAEKAENGVRVTLEREGKEETETFDRLLVAVGRKPLTRDLGIEKLGVKIDPRTGRIDVDGRYQTSVPGIYAIGDLVPGPMLAHKASAEGIAAVEGIAGKGGGVNYDAIPSVVYTFPEAAAVGLSEEEAKERGIPCCVGTYPFTGAGRARCMGETAGLAKIIAHEKTDRILGVHIVGARAADMIAEAVLALELGASAEDLALTVHGHPTFAEALQEAAKVVRKCGLY